MVRMVLVDLVLDVNVCAFMCLGSLRVKCLIKPEAI